jgi:outer membrane protein assembly factor BamE (lipoprotein component of BamABCDE complex)
MMPRGHARSIRLAAAIAIGLGVSGCLIGEDLQRGYVIDERAVAQVKPGTSGEDVLRILGTPSTVSTVGNKSWYYISQTATRRLQFMGESVTDQRVLAVSFNQGLRVERVALYGLQDGKVFDFISRRTETGGQEASFAAQLFRGLGSFVPKD